LSGALAMAGVLFAVPVPGVEADATEPFVRIVLCCFCGELCADGRAFLGELMEDEGCCVASGLVMDGRALEYRVLPAEEGMLELPFGKKPFVPKPFIMES
jgi:hypothetical protein